MKIDQELSEQIDAYIKGKLSDATLQVFEDRLQKEATFKALVEEQQVIVGAIKQKEARDLKEELIDLKKKLSSIHAGMEAQTAIVLEKHQPEVIVQSLNKQRPIRNLLAIAASCLLVVGGYFIYTNNGVAEGEGIVKQATENTADDVMAAARRHREILPIQNETGLKKRAIMVEIIPSTASSIKYTLDENKLVLFMQQDQVVDLVKRLYYEEHTPSVLFAQIKDTHYRLVPTDRPMLLEKKMD